MEDLYENDRKQTANHLSDMSGPNRLVAKAYLDDSALLGRSQQGRQGNAPSTIRLKSEVLRFLDRESNGKPWRDCAEEDLKGVLLAMKMRKMTPATVMSYKARIRGFLNWFWDQEGRDPPRWAKRLLRNELHATSPETRLIEPHELQRLLDSCDTLRTRAIIAFLAAMGGRASELLACNIGSFTTTRNGLIKVTLPRDAPKLKTGPRSWFLTEHLGIIRQWLVAHPFGDGPDRDQQPIFTNPYGKWRGKRLRYGALYQLLKRQCQKAGLPTTFNSHLFRHTLTTEQIAAGVPWATVAADRGWAINSRMAKTYVHMNDRLREREALKWQQTAQANEATPARASFLTDVTAIRTSAPTWSKYGEGRSGYRRARPPRSFTSSMTEFSTMPLTWPPFATTRSCLAALLSSATPSTRTGLIWSPRTCVTSLCSRPNS